MDGNFSLNPQLTDRMAGEETDYELAFRQLYCQEFADDELCNTLKLEEQLTLDDMIVFSYRSMINSSSNHTATPPEVTAIGGYMFTLLLALGMMGNLVTVVYLHMTSSNSSASSVYVVMITLLNMGYLICSTLTSALYFLGFMSHILTHGLFICMLWSPLLDLMTHITCWTIALVSLDLRKNTTQSTKTKKFQERLKMLAVVVATVFLNFHSTLLRDLVEQREDNYECVISSRVGDFYRNYYPWIKAALGIYIPWLVGLIGAVLTSIKSTQKSGQENCRSKPDSEQMTSKPKTYTALCWWYLLLTAVGRISFHLALYFNYKTDYRPHLNTILWLAGELSTTVMHTMSFIFILKPLIHCQNLRGETAATTDKQQTLQS